MGTEIAVLIVEDVLLASAPYKLLLCNERMSLMTTYESPQNAGYKDVTNDDSNEQGTRIWQMPPSAKSLANHCSIMVRSAVNAWICEGKITFGMRYSGHWASLGHRDWKVCMATCMSKIFLNGAMARSYPSRGVGCVEKELCGGAMVVLVRLRQLAVNRQVRNKDCLWRRGLKDIGKGLMSLDGRCDDEQSKFGSVGGSLRRIRACPSAFRRCRQRNLAREEFQCNTYQNVIVQQSRMMT